MEAGLVVLSAGRVDQSLVVVESVSCAHVIAHVGGMFSWDEAPSYFGMVPSPNAALISFPGSPDVTVGSWLPWARTALLLSLDITCTGAASRA